MPLALAPLLLDAWWLPVLLGAAFGATLERSGFGDARRLAAQFYFTEQRVLKVMFTAIVTCLLWITVATSAGLLDFGALAVNPTWLGTALVGGLLLGMGFVVGGYCPGTSLVAAATGKLDGLAFVGGVALGVFGFGETAGGFRVFYDTAGAWGRVTLPDALGLPFGTVVALVVVLAAGMFLAAEALERRFGPLVLPPSAPPADGDPALGSAGPAPARAPLRRVAARLGVGAGLAVALVGFARPASGAGAVATRVALLAPRHDATLAAREVHVDPVEALGLMHGRVRGAPARFRLELLDVRDESAFHRFHLADARRTTVEALEGAEGRALADPRHAASIVLVVSDDEARAEAAWRRLKAQGVAHAYVLAGGVNLWLDVFRDGRADAARATGAAATDRLRHALPASLGARWPFARPGVDVLDRLVASKARGAAPVVRPVAKAAKAGGGCG